MPRIKQTFEVAREGGGREVAFYGTPSSSLWTTRKKRWCVFVRALLEVAEEEEEEGCVCVFDGAKDEGKGVEAGLCQNGREGI